MTLNRAEFVYKNGHIQARVMMNLPAVELPNRTVPIQLPRTRKMKQQLSPRMKQDPATFFIMLTISSRLSVVCISATVGMSMMEIELVMADGKQDTGQGHTGQDTVDAERFTGRMVV